MRSPILLIALSLAAIAPAAAQRDERHLVHRRLADTTVIDGVACAPTGRAAATTWPNGRLEACPLARDTVVAGHALARGTWIYLTQERVLTRAWLSRDTRLDGHTCRGDGYKVWSTDFHANGAVALCWLAADTVIEGVPCRRASFWGEISGGVGTAFHANRRLAGCGLSRTIHRDGQELRARSRIRLDSTGVVLRPRRTARARHPAGVAASGLA